MFAETIDTVCAHLDPHLEVPLTEVVFAQPGSDQAGLWEQTLYAQTGLFAVQVGLVELLRSWGVAADGVIGHSAGELAAAYAAGVWSLSDACAITAERARVMQRLARSGAMLSVHASEGDITGWLGRGVELAAVNGADRVVVSGPRPAVVGLAGRLARAGVRCRLLDTGYAFHSAGVEQVMAELGWEVERAAGGVARTVMVSTLTGRPVGAEVGTAGYWREQARRPVRFGEAVECLRGRGVSVWVELGPAGLVSLIDQGSGVAVLDPRQGELEAVATALAFLHTHTDTPIAWDHYFTPPTTTSRSRSRSRVDDLPTYPFQHHHYWLTPQASSPSSEEDSAFWSLVDQQDRDGLAARLGVAPDDDLGTVLPALATWRQRHRDLSLVDSWRYRVEWRRMPASTPTSKSGNWLVVACADEHEELAATITRSLNGRATVVAVPPEIGREDLAARIRAALPGTGSLCGVVSLLGLKQDPHPTYSAVPVALLLTTVLVQALRDLDLAAEVPLWCVTSGAVAVDAADPLTNPTQAQVWGLGRVLGLEQPHQWGGLVDLPVDPDRRTLSWLADVLGADDDEQEYAIRPSGVFVRRLVRAPALDQPRQPWRPRGTALITGGTGGLGAHVARRLARAGAEHLVLISRRGSAADGAERLRVELTELGASVLIESCDVADREALARVLDGIPHDRPLTTVVHAAGVSGNHVPIAALGIDELASTTSAKVAGARHLDELTSGLDLDAFVLYSSGSAIWGSAGAGAYAAGNALLDAIAETRARRGLPAVSIAWGSWGEGGMVDDAGAELLASRGIQLMAPERAVDALFQAVELGETTITVADIDWARFVPPFTSARRRPLLDGIPDAVKVTEPVPQPDGGVLRQQLGSASVDERERILFELVRTEISLVLGRSAPDTVDEETPLGELGFDSLTTVDLRNRLSAVTGLQLPATLAFDHPNARSLSAYLSAELGASQVEAVSWDTELDRLADALRSDDQRPVILERLRELVLQFDGATTSTVGFDVDAASDDEVFEFIDKDLGLS
ncbi:SDR family NAD(P)-dependent oxidoreductase [Goodfellowiella coeruleoviolacea]|uniref:SDR family NAD(P)-dependent oxidoreductase n=1 Tax=Goodfellowiella coeruleoviolacea TaxID=334858 RepID=UPI0020A54788|nr:SDR family NAD(P)-dependent oxidoreductase [Goodfellowiella coeruleoviolacea]